MVLSGRQPPDFDAGMQVRSPAWPQSPLEATYLAWVDFGSNLEGCSAEIHAPRGKGCAFAVNHGPNLSVVGARIPLLSIWPCPRIWWEQAVERIAPRPLPTCNSDFTPVSGQATAAPRSRPPRRLVPRDEIQRCGDLRLKCAALESRTNISSSCPSLRQRQNIATDVGRHRKIQQPAQLGRHRPRSIAKPAVPNPQHRNRFLSPTSILRGGCLPLLRTACARRQSLHAYSLDKKVSLLSPSTPLSTG